MFCWLSPPTVLRDTFYHQVIYCGSFHGGSEVKNPPANAIDMGSVFRLGISSAEGNGNLLQYSCWGNPIDRGAWWATVHWVTKELDTT